MNLTVVCKWGDALSYESHALTDICQGGILSPTLFRLNVDKLIGILRDKAGYTEIQSRTVG